MPRTDEELRERFRELAADLEAVHRRWPAAADRDDLAAEKELIARESALLAEVDEVVREFRHRLDARYPRPPLH